MRTTSVWQATTQSLVPGFAEPREICAAYVNTCNMNLLSTKNKKLGDLVDASPCPYFFRYSYPLYTTSPIRALMRIFLYLSLGSCLAAHSSLKPPRACPSRYWTQMTIRLNVFDGLRIRHASTKTSGSCELESVIHSHVSSGCEGLLSVFIFGAAPPS